MTKERNAQESYAAIINVSHRTVSGYNLTMSDVGILPEDGSEVEVYCLWCHKVLWVIQDVKQTAQINVPDIPPHGVWAFRLRVLPKKESFLQK